MAIIDCLEKKEKWLEFYEYKVQGGHLSQDDIEDLREFIEQEEYLSPHCELIRFGVSNDIIKSVLCNFKGVEHRLEFVGNINGRIVYNDSKSTNCESTKIALSSFNQPTIILLGGLDRGHSFDELVPFMNNVKQVVCYGETKLRIKEFCDNFGFNCEVVDTLEEATNKAYELSTEGDVILLSPACASWDQFAKFEDRGELFKNTIKGIGEK